jgi:hypothetical protein
MAENYKLEEKNLPNNTEIPCIPLRDLRKKSFDFPHIALIGNKAFADSGQKFLRNLREKSARSAG